MTSSTGTLTLTHWAPRPAWWLLYISRADHAKALGSSKGSPADYYDHDQSPGYRAGMEAAFDQLFEHTGTLKQINAEFYKNLHDLAIFALVGGEELVEYWSTGDMGEVVVLGSKQAGSVRFPLAHGLGRTIAADLAVERVKLLDGGRTVQILKEPTNADEYEEMTASMIDDDTPILYACAYNVQAGMISVNYRRHLGPKLVDAVGVRWREEMTAATDRRQRLAAIARLIRALHVLHLFTNANGRLNITLLFNKLLLDLGLSAVSLTNQDDLFSGSYTVDEIVDELERELKLFPTIVETELARQERDGAIAPLTTTGPEGKVSAVKKSSEKCVVQ